MCRDQTGVHLDHDTFDIRYLDDLNSQVSQVLNNSLRFFSNKKNKKIKFRIIHFGYADLTVIYKQEGIVRTVFENLFLSNK